MKAGIGVEQRPLPSDRCRQPWVPVAKDRHVVDHVEIGPALDIEQVLLPAALDLRRIAVVVLLRPGEMLLTAIKQLGRMQRRRIAVETENARWRRA
ncbi:hypothetical protein D9M72_590880 [compost metagenome]